MPCVKLDCQYRNAGESYGNCNYYAITGNTKLGQMKHGERYDIENCPFYNKGRKLKASINPPFERANSVDVVQETMKMDSELAFELYDMKLSDNDIAMLMNTLPKAVAKWRQARGLLHPPGANQKYIPWDDIMVDIEHGATDAILTKEYGIDEKVAKLFRNYISGLNNE